MLPAQAAPVQIEAGLLCRSVFKHQITEITRIAERASDDLAAAFDLVFTRSGKILTSGVGKSGFVAERLAASLCSIGQTATFLHPTNALHGDLGVVQKGDILILFSNSGTTEDLVLLAKYAQSLGVKIVTITGRASSPLAAISDRSIIAHIQDEGGPFPGPPMVSITAASIICDALVTLLIHATGFTQKEFACFHPSGQLGKNLLLKGRDIMIKVEKLPLFDQQSILREVMIEMTSQPVGAALFTDKDGRLVGLLTDGDIRKILAGKNAEIDSSVFPHINRNAITVSDQLSVGDILQVMESKTRSLNIVPVVGEDNRLLGLIRIHDILQGQKT